MVMNPIASRYAEALLEVSKDADAVDETLGQLLIIRQALQEHPDARGLFYNPDVTPKEKVAVLDRSVQGQWTGLVRSFIQVVASFNRAECLDEIIEAFGQAVDAAQGRLRVTVRSASAISEELLERLRLSLAKREGKEILLRRELDAQLIGGLQIVLDHRVIDGSLRRQLTELRQRLRRVRVH